MPLSFETYGPESQEVRRIYDICGIINAEPTKKYFSSGNCLQNVPFITPRYKQCIVQIWSDSKETEPQFAQEWTDLQMIVARRATYAGVVTMDTANVYIYRLARNEVNRFVWLSDATESWENFAFDNFWDQPIESPDEPDVDWYIKKVNQY